MNLQSKSNLHIQGSVRIVKWDAITKEVIEDFDPKPNLVVAKARDIVRDLLFVSNPNYNVNILKLGNNNLTYPADASSVPLPVSSDTNLVNPVFSFNNPIYTTLVIAGRPAVEMLFRIDPADANDPNPLIDNYLITELGLFRVFNNTMFARFVKPIIKTRSVGLDVYWTIVV